MVFLVLSVLCSALNIWIFKLFEKFGVDNFPAIVVNYFVCVAVGFYLSEIPVIPSEIIQKDWLWISIALGTLFIGGFNLIAITTQRAGVAAVTVASKVSMVMPVAVAILFYGDNLTLQKLVGVLMVVGAIFFTAVKDASELKTLSKEIMLPLFVWITSGIIEILIDYAQRFELQSEDFPGFLVANFGLAGLIGLIVLLYFMLSNKQNFTIKHLIGGLILGVPNYFSIYFLLKALKESGIESSALFPIANIGIVLLAIMGGMLFFKERLSSFNWIGVGLAIVSIILIASA